MPKKKMTMEVNRRGITSAGCMYFCTQQFRLCVYVCSCSDRVKGGESRGGSIVSLCVVQIVLFSGKVETQHSSPEVWLPGEREGKKEVGEIREGELHRCGDRKRNREGEGDKIMRFQA